MEEKPLWVYVCQIVILGCAIAILVMMTVSKWGGETPSTFNMIVLGVGLALLFLVIVRWVGRRNGPGWRAISFWFDLPWL